MTLPDAMAVGAAGDIESLQPTTVTDSTTTDRNPMLFFMTLSLVPFKTFTLNPAAPVGASVSG
jgi:hypothetical protein